MNVSTVTKGPGAKGSGSRLVYAAFALIVLVFGVSTLASASGDDSATSPADSSSGPSAPKARLVVEGDAEASVSSSAALPQVVPGGYTFVPINPYRTMDTRVVGGQPLQGGNAEYFTVLTNVDDVPQIPAEAVAVTYNLTAAATVGSGYLAIYPADINWPGTSAINWSMSGIAIANGGTVAIGDYSGAIGAVEILLNPPGSSAHYILDITGYYV